MGSSEGRKAPAADKWRRFIADEGIRDGQVLSVEYGGSRTSKRKKNVTGVCKLVRSRLQGKIISLHITDDYGTLHPVPLSHVYDIST